MSKEVSPWPRLFMNTYYSGHLAGAHRRGGLYSARRAEKSTGEGAHLDAPGVAGEIGALQSQPLRDGIQNYPG